jgi:hypothetical protein
MSVEITHPAYDEHLGQWRRIDAALSGLDAVMRGGTDYLPMLAGQMGDPHAYAAYQKRAVWYGATARTLEALLGAIFRKDPTITVSTGLKKRLENIDARGNSIYTFSQKATRQVIAKGRYGILIDMPAKVDLRDETSLTPFLAGYSAASIRCWRNREINGLPKLDQVILQEFVQRPAEDGFGFETIPRYRVLELDRDGFYQVRMFVATGSGGGEFYEQPTIRPMPTGQRIDYIPFVFLNPGDLMPDVSKSPLLDLVDVNLAMYRASADLENGRHHTAHCTPYIIGLTENSPKDWRIGGNAVWQLPEGCSVGMLEYTGQGLTSLENGVAEKREMAAFLGARLLRDQKKAAETAEAQEIQQSGENATLASISRTVSDGFAKAFNIAEEWISSRKKAEFELNQDFFSRRMEAQELTALVAALQAGAIPLDDFLHNLKDGELLKPGRTVEEARELLDIDAARSEARNPDPVLAGQPKPATTAAQAQQQARDPGQPVQAPKARTT